MDNQTIGLLAIAAACLALLAWAVTSGPSAVAPVAETPAAVEESAPSKEKDTNTIIREQLGVQ